MGRNKPDEKSLLEGKMIGELLLTVIVIDPKQFNHKKKLVIYNGPFVKIYN